MDSAALFAKSSWGEAARTQFRVTRADSMRTWRRTEQRNLAGEQQLADRISVLYERYLKGRQAQSTADRRSRANDGVLFRELAASLQEIKDTADEVLESAGQHEG